MVYCVIKHAIEACSHTVCVWEISHWESHNPTESQNILKFYVFGGLVGRSKYKYWRPSRPPQFIDRRNGGLDENNFATMK